MNKEQKVAVLAVMFPCLVFANAAFQVYLGNREHDVSFTVFDMWCFEDKGRSVTQILTWGDSKYGKYYFIGNYTSLFELDGKYNVTYVQPGHALHPWNNLIIIEWEKVN